MMISKFILFFTLAFVLSGCDFLSKRKCAWYIMPAPPEKALKVESGWANVCLKNYDLGKQKCFMQIRIELAESLANKKVRYNDLDLDESTMPRTIHAAESCENE